MSLLRTELRRLTKRRFTRWMLVLVVGLMVTVALVAAAANQPVGPQAVAAAELAAQREYEDQQQWLEQDIEECRDLQETDHPDQEYWPVNCEEIREWYPSQEEMVQWHLPPTFEFRSEFPPMIYLLAGLLGMYAFIVGASFVGAEWRSGGMMNLLLWRPRRLLVFSNKLLALMVSLLGLGVLLGAVWTGAFWLVATYRGRTEGMTTGVWQSFALTGVRGLTLVLVAGALGFAIASIGRHTAAAMGAAIAAFVVGIAGVGMVLGVMLQVRFWELALWTTYLAAWMDKSITITDWGTGCEITAEGGACEPPSVEVTWQVAGIGIAAVAALLLGAAMWQMRRRDVA